MTSTSTGTSAATAGSGAVTSTGTPIQGYFKAPVNNALYDPLQGFDADVWVVDQATGGINMIGRFTSLQLTVRDSTEPYLEMNQRVPRYLNGEVQIGWVLERGLVDTRLLQAVFGFNVLSREMRFNRGPRMQITFDMNAPELQQVTGRASGANNGELVSNSSEGFGTRQATGQYRLTFCKPDSLTIGMQAGRTVIATRIEGLAEGIEFLDQSQLWAGVALNATTGNESLLNAANATGSLVSNPLGLPAEISNFSSNPGGVQTFVSAAGNLQNGGTTTSNTNTGTNQQTSTPTPTATPRG